MEPAWFWTFFSKLENLEKNELPEQLPFEEGDGADGSSVCIISLILHSAFLLKVLLCRVKTRRKGTHISCTKSYEHPMFIVVTVEPGISGFVNLL